MTAQANPAKTAATELKKLLRQTGAGYRIRRSFIMDRLGIGPDLLIAALDLIQAEGRVKIIRIHGQGGGVALA